MTVTILAAEGTTVGNPAANIGIFALFVAVTLFIVIRASKKNATAAEFFTAGRAFTGPQNGIAISGDYLSAASFLGIAGAIAVYGYDGFLYPQPSHASRSPGGRTDARGMCFKLRPPAPG